MSLRSPSNLRAAAPGARLSRSVAAALVLVALAIAGCSNKAGQQPGAQSPERQSDAEYDVARDLFQKGNPRAALDHAMKAVALNEDNDKAQYFVGVIHLSFCSTNRGLEAPDCRLSEVEKYARAALKANPQFRDATNMLGQVLINEKKYREAIVALEPLTRDPAYVHPYYAWGNLGWAQVLDGQVDAGIASLKNAIAAEPRFCVGQYRLGIAHEKKGEFPLAEQSLTDALTVADPNCENLQDAWEARGDVRAKLGRAPEAHKDYERCREISNETPTGKRCVQKIGTPRPATPSGPTPSGGAGGSQTNGTNPNETRKT